MGVSTDIVATWRTPRRVMRRHLARGQREDRALVFLMAACGLIFVAQWPLMARLAYVDPEIPIEARIGGALFAWMFWAPLLAYSLAALTRIVAGVLGGRGTWYTARLALFWSMLACTPAWLLYGLTSGFIGPGPAQQIVGLVLALAFLSIWGICLREAETNPTGEGAA